MNPPLPGNTPSDNQNVINQIDNFIAGLNMPPDTTVATAVVTRTSAPAQEEQIVVPKTDEEIQEFILKNSAQLATLSIKSVQDLQKVTVATGDPEQMAGLASLITAGAGAIETINKIHLQNKKTEAAKLLKAQEIEGKKEIQRLKNDGYLNLPAGQTNILVATREEIISQLTGKAKAKVTTEITSLSAIDLSSQPLSLEQAPPSSAVE